jgi:hypothetical protein
MRHQLQQIENKAILLKKQEIHMLRTHLGHRPANGLVCKHCGPLLGQLDKQNLAGFPLGLPATKRITHTP